MSVKRPSIESESRFETTDVPTRRCASYLGCRYCEEGSLVFDPELGASRCTACGELDD